MFKVNINQTSHKIDLQSDGVFVDNEFFPWDQIAVTDYLYHLISDSKSFVIEITATDAHKKRIQLKVNGVLFDIEVQDKYDVLLEKLGMQINVASDHHEVRAPMPGMIVDILVKEGQLVSKGEKLVILEAMKMENVIKSNGEGTVKTISIQIGMNVEKNQVLIQF